MRASAICRGFFFCRSACDLCSSGGNLCGSQKKVKNNCRNICTLRKKLYLYTVDATKHNTNTQNNGKRNKN